MSENSNVELIRGLYEAFTSGEMAVIDKAMADDILWRIPGERPRSGDRHSKSEVFEYFGRIAAESRGTFRVEVHEILGGGDRVVALVTEHGTREGKTLGMYGAHVWRVRDNQAVEFLALMEDQRAHVEFWS